MAALWNSSHFNPIAPASDCHFDFMTATDCSHEQVAGLAPATATRMEDVIASMRSDLLRIITRWEQSGQGEGGMDSQEEEQELEEATSNHNEDESFETTLSRPSTIGNDDSCRDNIGALQGRSPRALQSRAAFLNGRPSYLLYFWEVADHHQILQSSLQRLTNNAGAADASCAPSTTVPSSGGSRSQQRRRRPAQQGDGTTQDEDGSLTPLVESIKELADAQRAMVLDRAEDRIHEVQLEEQRHLSEGNERSRERVFRRRAELKDLARKYRKLNAELNPSDENSRRLSEFYMEEGRMLDDELRQLEN